MAERATGILLASDVRQPGNWLRITYTARFALEVTTAGSGSGFVDSSPARIDCGRNVSGHADCSQTYDAGTGVTLSAHAEPGSEFVSFSGGGCPAETSTCAVTLDQARHVTATFRALPTCQGEAATIEAVAGQPTTGTMGDDVIVGTPEADEISTLAGDDLVCSRAGEDRVFGGQGADGILAGTGADFVQGKRGADAIAGNGGRDELRGGKDEDELRGGRANDQLLGNGENDSLDGGSGRNTLNGGTGTNTCVNGPVVVNCGAS